MEINKIDVFNDNTRKLSTNYDFNKDGTVDIQDYNYALLSLEDDDVDNDVELSKDELQEVFADLIKEDNTNNPDNVSVNNDNITQLSNEVVETAKKNLKDPTTATNFTELQEIGKNLSSIIKRCTILLPYINEQMEVYNKELEAISEEKETQEKEYEEMSDKVTEKNEQLTSKMSEAMSKSETVTDKMRANTSNIISNCVEKYKNGEFEGQDLYTVITESIASDSSSSIDIDALNSIIAECGSLGDEIKSLCSDVENLVSNIRSTTQKFNSTTSFLNGLKESRNGIIKTSNNAQTEYQKGYQKRLDLREEISSKYGNGTDGLKAFLNSEDSTSIPFADAYAVMSNIAQGTGIKFKDGNIIMPNFIYMESESEITDDQRAQMKEFNEISDIINSKYASNGSTNSTKTSASANSTMNIFSSLSTKTSNDDDSKIDTDDEDVEDTEDIENNIEEDLEDVDTEDVDTEDSDDDISDNELEDVDTEEAEETLANADDDTDDATDEFNTGEPSSLGCCTKSTCCDPISFKQGNTSYHFISDNDKDGVFDGANEFLGASKGWEEMKVYDTNGDGKINGEELDKLKLVSTNDDNGQYNFMTASEAGIKEIDLSSYNKEDKQEVDGDILRGTFNLTMNDGSVIQGEQTDDTSKNIQNRYSTLFGAEIKEQTDNYKNNPFMDNFQEAIDTKAIKDTNESDYRTLQTTFENNVNNAQSNGDMDARKSSENATLDKRQNSLKDKNHTYLE